MYVLLGMESPGLLLNKAFGFVLPFWPTWNALLFPSFLIPFVKTAD